MTETEERKPTNGIWKWVLGILALLLGGICLKGISGLVTTRKTKTKKAIDPDIVYDYLN